MSATPRLGLGIGWRPEIALLVDRRADLGFVEILAEDFLDSRARLPRPIEQLRERGLAIVPHGVSLSLGGTEPFDRARIAALARLAERVGAPLISEHVAFTRAGDVDTGHLLPLPRTREALDHVVARVCEAQAALPVPLALENIATLFEWPGAEMDEAAFLSELLERTGVGLLLDVANLHANVRNHGGDSATVLDRLPLERIAYVHVAGGVERAGLYHDTHAHDVPAGVFALLAELCTRVAVPGAMLERDDHFPPDPILNGELDAIARATGLGNRSHARVG